MRDALTALVPRYVRAWNYESRPAGLDRVLVRYRVAEEQAQRYATGSMRYSVKTTSARAPCRRSIRRSARPVTGYAIVAVFLCLPA